MVELYVGVMGVELVGYGLDVGGFVGIVDVFERNELFSYLLLCWYLLIV